MAQWEVRYFLRDSPEKGGFVLRYTDTVEADSPREAEAFVRARHPRAQVYDVRFYEVQSLPEVDDDY